MLNFHEKKEVTSYEVMRLRFSTPNSKNIIFMTSDKYNEEDIRLKQGEENFVPSHLQVSLSDKEMELIDDLRTKKNDSNDTKSTEREKTDLDIMREQMAALIDKWS